MVKLPGFATFRFAPLLLAGSALLSCNNDPAGSDTPYVVVPVTSAALAGTAGWTLTDTLVVEVRDAEGRAVPGARVEWSLPNGGNLVVQLAEADDDMVGRSDDQGRNFAVWTLGLAEGTQVARVAVGFEEPAEFTATASVLHALSVTVGSGYFCAVLPDHRPVCWGDNRYGQLGTGDTLARSTPRSPVGLAAVQDIHASPGGHVCARDMTGDVWCWGYNNVGQSGPGAAQPLQLVPVRVAGAEGAGTVAVSSGDGHFSCAVLAAGGAKCWGNNGGGRLGTGDSSSSATPRPVVGGQAFTSISAGTARACAVTAAWDVWCWGDARYGEFSPFPPGVYLTPIQPVPGFNLATVALTVYANCGIGLGGEARCWGDSWKYATGGRPFGLTTVPVDPFPGTRFAQLVSNDGITMGRTLEGGLVSWGSAWGDNDHPSRALDIQVPAAFVALSAPWYCVISNSGALYCETTWDWFGEGRNHLQGVPDSLGS